VFVFDEEEAHGASIAENDEEWMKAITTWDAKNGEVLVSSLYLRRYSYLPNTRARWCILTDGIRNSTPLNASMDKSSQGLSKPLPRKAWFITSWA
jgi:hypothetical protein